jgi:hypothetical protein
MFRASGTVLFCSAATLPTVPELTTEQFKKKKINAVFFVGFAEGRTMTCRFPILYKHNGERD